MDKRIVITGMGVISPIGNKKDAFWNALISGTSGVSDVTSFDTSVFKVHKGCFVKDFNYDDYVSNGSGREIGKGSQFAIAAAKLAIEDSNVGLNNIDPERAGVSIGTTAGEIQILEKVNYVRHEKGDDSVDPGLFLKHPCVNMPSNISIEFGFKGPSTIIPTACAARKLCYRLCM